MFHSLFLFPDQPALLTCHWIDPVLPWCLRMRHLSVLRLTEHMSGQRPLRMNAKFSWYWSIIFNPLLVFSVKDIYPNDFFFLKKHTNEIASYHINSIEDIISFLLRSPEKLFKHSMLIYCINIFLTPFIWQDQNSGAYIVRELSF